MIVLLAWLSIASVQETAGSLYERAYYLEQGRGDLEGAILLYERVVDEFPTDSRTAARALLRLGICYEQLGLDGAMRAYERLLAEYSNETAVVNVARARLAALEALRSGERVELPSGAVLREIVLPNGDSVGDGTAVLSPDGRRLVHYDMALGGLVVTDLERRRVVVTTAVDFSQQELHSSYRWSRDGNRVAFNRFDGSRWSLEVLEVRSGDVSVWDRGVDDGYFGPLDWDESGNLWAVRVVPDGRTLVRYDRSGRPGDVFPYEGGIFSRVSPDGKWIAFELPGDPDLFVQALPTGEAVRLPSHPAVDHEPLWSADGRYLGFMSRRTERWDFWAMEIDEGRPKGEPFLVTPNLGDVSLRFWLPDGRLVFTRTEMLRDVWLLPMRVGTGEPAGEPVLLPRTPRGWNIHPRWTKGGTRLLYRALDSGVGAALVIAGVDGRVDTRLPNTEGTLNAIPSPDGSRIWQAILTDDRAAWTVEEIDVASGERRRPLGELRFRWPPTADFDANGRRVYFTRADPESEDVGLYVFDSATVELLPGIETSGPVRWSPDGEWIGYKAQSAIFVARDDGSEKRIVVDLPEGEFMTNWIAWSPDARFIAYARGRRVGPPRQFERELWIAAVDGSSDRPIESTAELRPLWMDWAPDGSHIAFSSLVGEFRLWVMDGFWPAEAPSR